MERVYHEVHKTNHDAERDCITRCVDTDTKGIILNVNLEEDFMTDIDGKPLPECAANIAILQTTGQSLNRSFGEMRQEFIALRDNLYDQQAVVGKLTGSVERLTTVVEKLSDHVELKIKESRQEHESNCAFFQVAKVKTVQDITKKFKTEGNSLPPSDPSANPLEATIKKLPKKIQPIIYVILGILTVAGSVIGYFAS